MQLASSGREAINKHVHMCRSPEEHECRAQAQRVQGGVPVNSQEQGEANGALRVQTDAGACTVLRVSTSLNFAPQVPRLSLLVPALAWDVLF